MHGEAFSVEPIIITSLAVVLCSCHEGRFASNHLLLGWAPSSRAMKCHPAPLQTRQSTTSYLDTPYRSACDKEKSYPFANFA